MSCEKIISCAGLLLALALPGAARAQSAPEPAAAAPSAQQIIDALKPHKARLRNLGVQEVSPPAGGAAEARAEPAPAAAQVAAPAPAAAPAIPHAIDLAIQFEFNSNRIAAASQKALEALAQALNAPELASLRFRIEGHTDNKGLAAYNQKLSQGRADQVKRMLVKSRVGAERLFAQGKGSSEPLNPDDPGAPENRRVRIIRLEP